MLLVSATCRLTASSVPSVSRLPAGRWPSLCPIPLQTNRGEVAGPGPIVWAPSIADAFHLFWILGADCLILGWSGSHCTPHAIRIGQLWSAYSFLCLANLSPRPAGRWLRPPRSPSSSFCSVWAQSLTPHHFNPGRGWASSPESFLCARCCSSFAEWPQK